MKKQLSPIPWLAALALLAASCSDPRTVNILIENHGPADAANARVVVRMADVRSRLASCDGDTLVLLDEKNRPVPYSLTPSGTAIVFCVPVVRRGSQKTYSARVGDIRLADNFLVFRRKNIVVEAKP